MKNKELETLKKEIEHLIEKMNGPSKYEDESPPQLDLIEMLITEFLESSANATSSEDQNQVIEKHRKVITWLNQVDDIRKENRFFSMFNSKRDLN